MVADYGAHKDKLKDLLLFWSSKEGKNTTLAAYKDRMPEEQPYYYYACGESVEKIAKLPQVERILDKGYEILYCTEDVDDFVMQALGEIDGKKFMSATDEDALPQTDEEKKAAEEKAEAGKPVLEAVKEVLGDQVKEVRISKILKSGACCLSADGPVSLEMERYMRKLEGGEHMKARAGAGAQRRLRPLRRPEEGGGFRRSGHRGEVFQAALRPGPPAGRPAPGGPV